MRHIMKIEKIPTEIEYYDECDPEPMTTSMAMFPTAAVILLTTAVNKLIDATEELNRRLDNEAAQK